MPAPGCDIRFGCVGWKNDGPRPFPPTALGEPAAQEGPAETVEVPYEKWLARGEGDSWPESRDLCVRLGRRFARPAAGMGEARAYAADVAECHRLAGAAAGRASPAAYLLEFPPAFAYSLETRRHLDRVLKDLSGLPLAVAFFDASWYSSRVIEGLKARGVCLCLMDAPRRLFSPPSIDVVTAPLVYVKFYGRAGATFSEEAEARDVEENNTLGPSGDYEYDDAELMAWLPRLEVLAAQAETLRVIFAARRGEAGAKNARRLAGMWRERSLRSPKDEATRSGSLRAGS